MSPELVIFDCDGVLIDSEAIACAVDAEELTAAGYPISTSEVVHRFTGWAAREMVLSIEHEWGRALPADFSARVEARVLARYREDLAPITGVAETLRQLPWRFCVASSSKPSKLGLGLIETGLFDFFYPHIYSSVLVAKGKPAPDLFLFAADSMGVDAGSCVVIEDSIAGVTAARCAGMRVLGFTGGKHCGPDHGEALRKAGAEWVFDVFADLPALIAQLPDVPAVTKATAQAAPILRQGSR